MDGRNDSIILRVDVYRKQRNNILFKKYPDICTRELRLHAYSCEVQQAAKLSLMYFGNIRKDKDEALLCHISDGEAR